MPTTGDVHLNKGETLHNPVHQWDQLNQFDELDSINWFNFKRNVILVLEFSVAIVESNEIVYIYDQNIKAHLTRGISESTLRKVRLIREELDYLKVSKTALRRVGLVWEELDALWEDLNFEKS